MMMSEFIIVGVGMLFLNLIICIINYVLYKRINKVDAKGIDRFYIYCPGCGRKINLAQTHVYMEDKKNDEI